MNANQRRNNKKLPSESPKENIYYLNIAKKYKSSKFILTIIFIIYLILMIVLYRDQLTLENFRYMMKYLDTNSPEYTGLTRTIYYDPTAELQIDLYKGDLAVVRSKSADIYNMIGNVMLSYNINYTQPVLLTSKKYMLIYSQGDKLYTVNNAFSQLHSETMDYPITGAALSDNGMYAIVSRNIEYRSVVYVYDRDFNLISQIMKDKPMVEVQINPAGTEILTVSSYTQGGEFHTEVMTISPYSEKETSIDIQESVFVVKAKYNSVGGYAIICDTKILFYNENHTLINTFSFDGGIPIEYHLGSDYTVIVFNENIVGNNNNIYVFDKQGELVYNDVLNGQISDITSSDKCIFVLFNNNITEINISSAIPIDVRKHEFETAGSIRALLKDSDKIIICYPQSAVVYIIEELFDSGGTDEFYN